jgi:hypothetical protein
MSSACKMGKNLDDMIMKEMTLTIKQKNLKEITPREL